MKMELPFYVFIFALSVSHYLKICLACESGHIAFNGSCYYFSSNKSDFYSSGSSCEDLGMHVVDIETQEEQDFLVKNLPDDGENYWIGLSALTWLDGSRLAYDNFGHGDKGAFDDGGQCFRILPSGFKWYDKECSKNFRYICEIEGGCDSDLKEHDGSCYYFSPNESDFSTSKSFCEGLDMHLVFISSQEEQEFLVKNLPDDKEEYWIGLTTVEWATDISMLPYANFGSSWAFNDGRVCYRMVSSSEFKWLDDSCSSSYHFICESEEVTTSSLSPPSTKLTGTTEQGSTEATPKSTASTTHTHTTPTTKTTGTTQKISATETSSSHRQAQKRSINFKLLADNTALVDAHVRASHPGSSLIGCSQQCFSDPLCSCFTYIAHEKACFLGEACQDESGSNFELRRGAKTYQ